MVVGHSLLRCLICMTDETLGWQGGGRIRDLCIDTDSYID